MVIRLAHAQKTKVRTLYPYKKLTINNNFVVTALVVFFDCVLFNKTQSKKNRKFIFFFRVAATAIKKIFTKLAGEGLTSNF